MLHRALKQKLDVVLETLGIKKRASDHGVHAWFYLGDTIIISLPTNNVLLAVANEQARSKVETVIGTYFFIVPNHGPAEFRCLNCCAIRSDTRIAIDQSYHIIRMCREYYQGRAPSTCDKPFRTDKTIEDDHAAIKPCSI